jgi:hypothetical protein
MSVLHKLSQPWANNQKKKIKIMSLLQVLVIVLVVSPA